MTSLHAAVTVDGLTQASRVIAVVRCREAVSGTVTSEFEPLNTRALPYLPEAVHVVLVVLPLLPVPEESATVAPVPSLKEYAATNPDMVAVVVALATVE